MPNTVSLRLESGLRFVATTGTGFEVPLDSGNSEDTMSAPSPMEMQLVALGGCTVMDVISILRKMREDVRSYDIRLTGDRATEHPRVYSNVLIEHDLAGTGIDCVKVHRAIQLTMERYCPVFAMLYPSVPVQERFRVTDDATNAVTEGDVVRGEPASLRHTAQQGGR